jgi:hypothetical protein
VIEVGTELVATTQIRRHDGRYTIKPGEAVTVDTVYRTALTGWIDCRVKGARGLVMDVGWMEGQTDGNPWEGNP